ncbi:MAG: zinc-dependent metalloprotease [Micropruina sp.]|uniref:zinc-dependent metalloprotease n=1 Tax=Micropruina sp. TaxID=2737536 RepID=UPI0039E36049
MATEPELPDDADRPNEENPLAQFLAQFGITPGPDGEFDMAALTQRLQSVMAQFQTQMAGFGPTDSSSGMNWTFTKDIARRVTSSLGADPTPSASQAGQVRDASGLADLWLDEAIAFPRVTAPVAAWSRADWVEGTFETWQKLGNPIVTSLSTALGALMAREAGPGEEFMKPMVRAAASGMFAAQVGQSLGSLSAEVLSVSDIGLPLGARPQVALLPANIEAFGAELESVTPADVLLFLALRETARQRLFAAVGWLGPQLHALVEHYARDITIDTAALEQAIEQHLSAAMSADDLERAGQTLAGKLFEPAVTPEQAEVLERLETLLALVEGWVDEVVGHTMAKWMPNGAALTEIVRRRRAAGGPAETALKSLVGLELRPRRTRDAANLWAAVRATRGAEARDAAWDHPDLIPTAADLDDPLGYAEHGHVSAPDDLDAELQKLLDQEGGR